MTVSLGGVVLSDDLTLTGPINQSQIIASFKRTVAGRIIRRVDPRPGGREMVLSTPQRGGGYRGVFTGSQAEQLAALRDAGDIVPLVHHRGSFAVLITVVDLTPIDGSADPGPTTYFVGQIITIEV